ncbi:hypothetical protein OHB00_49415 [Streptomyces sp. NBC_00631]|uniref:terpene synthase family protein n=1 Tax=Streptomyces sp. NBC_00631 TaxID=2975793 RepID=UPI0030DFEAE3
MTYDDARLAIPPFYCPIEGGRHPEAKAVEQLCTEWIDAFGFCRNEAERTWLLATRSADFCARFAPASTAEGLLVYALWVYWAFAFDDAFCDEGPMSHDPGAFGIYAGEVQRVWETSLSAVAAPSLSTDPYKAALCDIGRRTRALSTTTHQRRLIDNHRRWLFGVQWQIGNRAAGQTPDLNGYFGMRLGSCAGALTIGWTEIANGIEVPPEEMDSAAVQALTEMAGTIAAMDNDRHSLPKDVHRNLADQNFATVVARAHSLPLEQAVGEAVAIRDRIMLRFLELRDHIRPVAGPALRQYLDDLGHAIRGNADWGMRVTRYHNHASRAEVPELLYNEDPIDWADEPATRRADPLPYPTLSWWWDNLQV